MTRAPIHPATVASAADVPTPPAPADSALIETVLYDARGRERLRWLAPVLPAR